MPKDRAVSRPLKKVEFEIRFATREAERGRQELSVTFQDPEPLANSCMSDVRPHSVVVADPVGHSSAIFVPI